MAARIIFHNGLVSVFVYVAKECLILLFKEQACVKAIDFNFNFNLLVFGIFFTFLGTYYNFGNRTVRRRETLLCFPSLHTPIIAPLIKRRAEPVTGDGCQSPTRRSTPSGRSSKVKLHSLPGVEHWRRVETKTYFVSVSQGVARQLGF